ncbi:hypothetical protein ACIOG4_37560 [Streptomyces microflavus]|uniref:hypothetical protein n=1 Tax=Streptomyces microflavus TaxID=1919 RepID=UPI00382FDF6D
MNDFRTLTSILGANARCELAYRKGCQGLAVDHVPHPSGEALGEDWGSVWICDGDCAKQAARDS